MWQILLIFGETILLSCSFYLVPKKYKQRDRDDSVVIILRTIILSVFILLVSLVHKAIFRFDVVSEAEIWGLYNPRFLLILITTCIHIIILFSGTLVKVYYWSRITATSFASTLLDTCNYNYSLCIDLRNLVFSPLLEELLYRGNMLPFLLHSGFSLPKAVWFSSIAFGSCHFHHLFSFLQNGYPLVRALLQCCFMFTYTTLFGVLVSYVYVRTGNLLAAGLVHSLCNFFSIPSFEYNRPSSPLYSKRTIINGAYVVGVILFIVLFPILLNPQWC
ncbi:hypothetical protein WA171_004660, partial [Blastocystis sp. BT1]